MHVNPPPVFARDLRVVPDGPMFFCALRKIAGSLRGRTSIISLIISHWADIHWEGDMFHDMSEINLCFSHFRRNWLEGFQGDAAGYWFIISGVHNLGVGNDVWYIVGGWRGIPGGWFVSYNINCRNVVVVFVVGVNPVSGGLLCGACSCGGCICSHVRVWGGAGFIFFWRGSKFFLGLLLNSRAILRMIASDYSTIFSSVFHITCFSVSSQ